MHNKHKELEISNRENFEKFAPLYDTMLSREKLLENPFYNDVKNNLQELGCGTRLLDAGCGTGDLCIFFANDGYNVTGVDYSDKMLIVARNKVSLYKAHMTVRKQMTEDPKFQKNNTGAPELSSVRPKMKFLVGDVLDMSAVKDNFDVVTMTDTLAYIAPESLGRLFSSVGARLAQGGHFCVALNTELSFNGRVKRPEDYYKNFMNYSSGFSYDESLGAYRLEMNFKVGEAITEPVDVVLYEFHHPLRSFIDRFTAAGFQIVRMVPNTPVFSHDESDLNMIIQNIESTFAMPNGVFSVMIVGRKL